MCIETQGEAGFQTIPRQKLVGLSTWKALNITPQGQKFNGTSVIGVKVVVYKFTQANCKKPLDNYIIDVVAKKQKPKDEKNLEE